MPAGGRRAADGTGWQVGGARTIVGALGIEAAGWLGSLVIAFLGSWGLLEVLKRTGRAAAGERTHSNA